MAQVISWRDVWEEFQVKGKDIIDLVEVYEATPDDTPDEKNVIDENLENESYIELSNDQIIRTPFPDPKDLIIAHAQQEYITNVLENELPSGITTLNDSIEIFQEALECKDETFLSRNMLETRPILPVSNVIKVYPDAMKQIRAEYLIDIKLKQYEEMITDLHNKLFGSAKEIPDESIATELESIIHDLLHYCNEDKLISMSKSLTNLLDARDESQMLNSMSHNNSVGMSQSIFTNLAKLEQRSQDIRIESLFTQMGKFHSSINNLEDNEIDYELIGGCASLRNSFAEVKNRVVETEKVFSSAVNQLNKISDMTSEQIKIISKLLAK